MTRVGPGSYRSARPALVVASGGILLITWILASRQYGEIILPAPDQVWDAFREDLDRGAWWNAVRGTLEHVSVAFGLVLLVGTPLGIAMGRSWVLEDLLRVPVIFLQTVPTIVLVAIALLAIGTTSSGVVFVAVASSLPFFTLNVIQGTRAVDHDLVEMAHAYGANERAVVSSIVLPSLVPFLLAGGRIALGIAWHVALVAEYLMGTPSVGFAIANDIRLLDTASVFSWGLTIVAFTIAIEYGAFRPLEALLSRHARGTS